jgi:hypothetical protein
VYPVLCPVSTERTEQQSNRATEHSVGHVTYRSAAWQLVVANVATLLILCLRHHHILKDRHDSIETTILGDHKISTILR